MLTFAAGALLLLGPAPESWSLLPPHSDHVAAIGQRSRSGTGKMIEVTLATRARYARPGHVDHSLYRVQVHCEPAQVRMLERTDHHTDGRSTVEVIPEWLGSLPFAPDTIGEAVHVAVCSPDDANSARYASALEALATGQARERPVEPLQ